MRTTTYFLVAAGALVIVALVLLFPKAKTEADAGLVPITGYAWSDTIGWIDLNCSNGGTCGANNFGLSIGSDGALSGYAWSDNIGWVSANASDVSGCPQTPCTPKLSSSALTGWLKALAGGTAQSGSWDGWISLNGTGYGPTPSGGAFSGYAWGSDVVGWVDFSLARTTWAPCVAKYYCTGNDLYHRDSACAVTLSQTCVYQCSFNACLAPPAPTPAVTPSDGSLKAAPSLVRAGNTSRVSWNIQHVQSCSVTGNGDSWTGASGASTTRPILQQTTYALSCLGLDDSTFTQAAIINIVPVFREI